MLRPTEGQPPSRHQGRSASRAAALDRAWTAMARRGSRAERASIRSRRRERCTSGTWSTRSRLHSSPPTSFAPSSMRACRAGSVPERSPSPSWSGRGNGRRSGINPANCSPPGSSEAPQVSRSNSPDYPARSLTNRSPLPHQEARCLRPETARAKPRQRPRSGAQRRAIVANASG